MKRLKFISILSAILSICLFYSTVVSSASMENDFAIYIYDHLNFTNSGSIVEGNAVALGIVNGLGWSNPVKDGELYADVSNIPEYTGEVIKEIDKYLSDSEYTGEVPNINIQLKDFPVLEEKGVLSTLSNGTIISESGWYSQINIMNNGTDGLVINAAEGEIIEIRANKLVLDGQIKVNGSGIVLFYINELVCVGNNDPDINSRGTAQIGVYLADNNNINFSNLSGNFSLFSKNSNITFTNSTDIIGNIYLNGRLTMDNGSYKGYVGGNNLDVFMKNSAKVEGRIVSNKLELTGGSKVEFANVTDINGGVATSLIAGNAEIPEEPEVPEIPEVPELPINDEYAQGILGEYFDAPETYNESALKMKRIDSRPFFNWQLGSPHEVIEPEYFAVRWTGYIKTDKTATYTFRTLSDDGVHLKVNNVELIRRWGLVNLDYTISEPIMLEAGVYYPIELEYQQLPFNSLIYLFWETEEEGMSSIPASAFFVDKPVAIQYETAEFFNQFTATGTGLLNSFYQTEADVEEGIAASEEVGEVDYDFGFDSPNNITEDSFFGTMIGYIKPKFTERLTLSFEVDDAIRVWVDDQLIIDSWTDNSREFIEGQFDAIAGQKSKIVIKYADFGGGATCIMRWESNLQIIQVVPAKYLYTN